MRIGNSVKPMAVDYPICIFRRLPAMNITWTYCIRSTIIIACRNDHRYSPHIDLRLSVSAYKSRPVSGNYGFPCWPRPSIFLTYNSRVRVHASAVAKLRAQIDDGHYHVDVDCQDCSFFQRQYFG